MSSAKRRINSTGRKRISRDHIDIRMLAAEPGEPLKAVASVSLGELDFPGSASVALEAYHKSSGMRFDCGSVAALSIPPVLSLDEVDHTGNVLFRLKVIDTDVMPGRLLGSAERIQPRSEDDEDGRRSIFPIWERDLHDEVWKVEIGDEAGPTLILNNRIPGFKHRILDNPLVQGVILPAALEQVLQKLVSDPDDDDDDEFGWKQQWYRYCQEELEVSGDPSDMTHDERIEWSEDVVRRFCRKCGFVAKIRQSVREWN